MISHLPRVLLLSLALFAPSLFAATFTVTNVNDSGAGSLRQAIIDHNTASGTNNIVFNSGVSGAIPLTSGELSVTAGNLTVTGPGASTLSIDGQLSGRCVSVTASGVGTVATATFSGLKFTNGSSSNGGGMLASATDGKVDLTLTDCSFANCFASSFGSALAGLVSGTAATPTVEVHASGCSFTSCTSGGGTIFLYANFGPVSADFTNCTISGNTASTAGGFYLPDASQLTISISNCTVAENFCTSISGGGLFAGPSSTVELQNNIIAGNFDGGGMGDASGFATSLGGNVIGWGVGFNMTALSSDQVGGVTVGGNVVPGFSPLALNGGSTLTHAIGLNSPARDSGVSAGAPAVDQRAEPRDAFPDAGAYEFQFSRMAVSRAGATVANGSVDLLPQSTSPGSLIQVTYAISNSSQANADLTITLPLTVSLTANCTATVSTPPASTLAPGASDTIVFDVVPTAAGLYYFEVSMLSNDPDDSPFTMIVYGVAISSASSSGGGGSDDSKCSSDSRSGPGLLILLAALAAFSLPRVVRSRSAG